MAASSGFVTDCAVVARALGASATAVHTEEFFADPEPWTEAPPAAPEGSVRQRANPAFTPNWATTAVPVYRSAVAPPKPILSSGR